MSAIIIDLTDTDKALIATDTLVVNELGAPAGFTSKALVVPHLNMVIAGTGVAGIASCWLRCVNEELSPLGIEWLNAEAPKHLKRMLESELARWGASSDLHSTSIYHVGFSEIDGSLKGFQLNSKDGFKAQQLPAEVARKPASGPYPDGCDEYERIAIIMHQQRKLQEGEPFETRLHIGGHIQLIELSRKAALSVRICPLE